MLKNVKNKELLYCSMKTENKGKPVEAHMVQINDNIVTKREHEDSLSMDSDNEDDIKVPYVR